MPGRQPSMFETTHALGAHIASSPLLAEAWRLSAAADAAAGAGGGAADGSSFVARRGDGVAYVAFSGLPVLSLVTTGSGAAAGFFRAAPVSAGGPAGELFSQLAGGRDDGEPPLVHSAALDCFLATYGTPEFQAVLEEVQLDGGHRGLVFTGRSAGGAVASLAALSALCLSRSRHTRSPAALGSVLCITFGSSPLGNEPFARAVLREGWGGRFCHLVSRGDALPRLLFCPAAGSVAPEAVAAPGLLLPTTHAGHQTSDFSHLGSFYRPFGSYLFCSARGGAVCVDNPEAIVKMLYLTSSAGVDHDVEKDQVNCYGALVDRLRRRSLLKGSVLRGDGPGLRPTSTPTLEAGISVALEALGIEHHFRAAGQDFMGAAAEAAAECLRAASTIERTPSLNSADMAKELAGVTPWRAQIEWYKSSCDEHLGYYDAFKRRGISRKENHVNGNRLRLARFWDGILGKLERNELPPDFPRRHKWVNASQFYKLLVEPLDIAEYYRSDKHRTALGHYLGAGGGRARRYRVFDRWWEDKARRIGRAGMDGRRSRFASLTQDSCFWARVEEARDMAARARGEGDPAVLRRLWKGMAEFERHATNLIERKEVSVDVLATDSSFRVWQEEWKRLKSEKAAQSQEHPML